MSKLIILCADGASASFRNRHVRTYMSDVVNGVMKTIAENLTVDKYLSGVTPVVLASVRGGAFRGKRRQIRRLIERHNQVGNTLLCVGKSYGGYNLIEVLKEFMSWSNYSRVNLFLVDACSLDKIIGQRVWIDPPKVDELWNYHQHNNRYMNGYIVQGWGNRIHQVDLSGQKDLNHWNIVESEIVEHSVKQVIEGLING